MYSVGYDITSGTMSNVPRHQWDGFDTIFRESGLKTEETNNKNCILFSDIYIGIFTICRGT